MPGLVDIHAWEGSGYRPLVYSGGWMAALLNWEPAFDLRAALEVERHRQTDEVFVLLQGKAALLVSDGMRSETYDMLPGQIYNVRMGVWHALLATPDVRFLIVENRDTDLHDNEIRAMTNEERQVLLASLPGWVIQTDNRPTAG